MPVVTVAQFKAVLPGYSGTADDAQLAVELLRAEAECAAACGWPAGDDGVKGFESNTYTIHADSPSPLDLRLLPLPLRNVTTITSAHASGDAVYDSSSLIASSAYVIAEGRGVWLTPGGGASWVQAPRGNRVVCVAGWAEGAAPADVEGAVLAQAKYRWQSLRTGQDVSQASFGGQSVTRPSVVQSALSPIALSALMASDAWRWEAACG